LCIAGFVNHENVRCQGHYLALDLAVTETATKCEEACAADLNCRSFSRELNPTSDTYACFLFDEKASCVSFERWESGFKGSFFRTPYRLMPGIHPL
jgi:hypothetical protein